MVPTARSVQTMHQKVQRERVHFVLKDGTKTKAAACTQILRPIRMECLLTASLAVASAQEGKVCVRKGRLPTSSPTLRIAKGVRRGRISLGAAEVASIAPPGNTRTKRGKFHVKIVVLVRVDNPSAPCLRGKYFRTLSVPFARQATSGRTVRLISDASFAPGIVSSRGGLLVQIQEVWWTI